MSSPLEALRSQRGAKYLERREAWRRPEGALPRILGHRGARHAEPENTRSAFDRALAEGADGVELDVRMTGDGELVVAHDPELPHGAYDALGACGRPLLSELSLSQLAEVRLAHGERILTLEAALAWQKDTGAFMNVELKGDVPSRAHLARATSELLRRHGGDRILISSFYPRLLMECALRLPDIPTAWLVHRGQRLMKKAPGWHWTGAAAVHLDARDLSEARALMLRQQGALVNVWTVNDARDAQRLAALGVDGLITDCPGALLRALNADV